MPALLSGPAVQPGDSYVDQELSDGCDNSTSSPDGAMPAKCSTLGLTTNVGSVEEVDSSRQSEVVSTVSPGPVRAPPPSTMQQYDILKPGKHAPSTYSTVVLDMGSDAMRAKRDTKTVQAGLVYTHTAVAVFPATTPPHLPDQPRLLLDRPPPWPPWKLSSMLHTTHGTTCLLPVPSRPWKRAMSLWSVQTEQKQHQALWLLSLSACGQAKCLEGEGWCTPSMAPPYILSTFGLVPEDNFVPHTEMPLFVEVVPQTTPILAENLPSPLVRQLAVLKPDKGMFTTCSSGVLEDEVDATQLDIKDVPTSTTSSPQIHAVLLKADTCNKIQVGNVVPFDPGRKLQSRVQAWVAIPLTSSEVCLLPGDLESHEKLNLDSICNILSTDDNQGACKISSGGIHINFHTYNRLLVDALGRIVAWKGDSNWLYMGRSIINASDIYLTMSWDSGIMAAVVPSSMHCCDSVDVSLVYKHIHILVSFDGIECAEFIKPQSMLHMIVQAVHPYTENKLPDFSAACATCENLLARPTPDYVAFYGDSIENLVMLSVTLPWDPGVFNQLSTEVLRSEWLEQHTSGAVLIIALASDYFSHCLCTLALYPDHLSKHHGTQHQYIALWTIFWFAYEKNGSIFERMICWALDVWALANQLSELQPIQQTTLQAFLVSQSMSFPTWTVALMFLLLFQNKLAGWYALGSLWFKLGPTWRNTNISCKTSALKLAGSGSRTEPILLFDVYAVVSPCQMLFILVQSHHFLMENWIQAPCATWRLVLLAGAAKQWTKIQTVQPVGVQSVLMLQLFIALQPKYDGWVILRRVLPAPTAAPLQK